MIINAHTDAVVFKNHMGTDTTIEQAQDTLDKLIAAGWTNWDHKDIPAGIYFQCLFPQPVDGPDYA